MVGWAAREAAANDEVVEQWIAAEDGGGRRAGAMGLRRNDCVRWRLAMIGGPYQLGTGRVSSPLLNTSSIPSYSAVCSSSCADAAIHYSTCQWLKCRIQVRVPERHRDFS